MIKIINGDIFKSEAEIICHQVNCQGVMGSGVAKQVKELYPNLFKVYKDICSSVKNKSDNLGRVYTYTTLDNKLICNLFAQEKYGYDGRCYTDYNALEKCLYEVSLISKQGKQKTIAIPYLMGCHRGGGNWDKVNKLIEECLKECNVKYYKYRGD